MYFPTIKVKRPQLLRGLQPGQWIDYEGSRGRFMGRMGSTVWIAWGSTATKRFARFAAAYRAQMDRPAFRRQTDMTTAESVAFSDNLSYISACNA